MTQVAASWMPGWEKLCWIDDVLVYILASFPSKPPLRLRDYHRDTSVQRHGRPGHLPPPPVLTMYDHQHIKTRHPPSPFICQGEKDWHSYALLPLIGLGSFGIYELASSKRAEGGKKNVFVGLTFLMSLFCLCYFFSFTKDNNEKKKQGKLNVVDKFQAIMK